VSLYIGRASRPLTLKERRMKKAPAKKKKAAKKKK
jgi:hypothetical protein